MEGMQKEHDEFTSLIRDSVGAQVYRLRDLLIEVMFNNKIKQGLLAQTLIKTDSISLQEDILARYSTAEIASMLIAGIKVKEIQGKIQSSVLERLDKEMYIVNPSPNLYFMRDPAAVVQDGVIGSHMKFSGRQGESGLLKTIFENHQDFKELFNQIYPVNTIEDDIPTIEGGDVIVLSAKALAIGCSERTDEKAIELVARQVLNRSTVERVYQVDLPSKRNFMHLDTVFTIIDENLIVTYPDAMNSVLQTCVYRKENEDENGDPVLNK